MEILPHLILPALVLAWIVGAIWMVIAALRVSVVWFLAVILIPGAALVFAILHWDVAKKPFFLYAGPGVLGIAAAILIPNMLASREAEEAAMGEASAIGEAAPAPASAPDLGTSGEFAERFLRGDPTATCPPDATPQGARPPKGLAIWCEQDGMKHGPHATWHPNGRPASAGLYRDGKREGVWLRYHAKGGLEASASFRGDLQHGPMREYDPFGRVSRETHWVDGAPAG